MLSSTESIVSELKNSQDIILIKITKRTSDDNSFPRIEGMYENKC